MGDAPPRAAPRARRQRGAARHVRADDRLYWAFVVALLTHWIVAGRSATSLGLAASGGIPFAVTMTASVLVTVLLLGQVRAARSMTSDTARTLRRQMGSVETVAPQTTGEQSVWFWVSVTAGFCEELWYRGFLIAYLAPWIGWWQAAVASSVLFGIGHTYQGPAGVLKTTIVGLVMAALYRYSGSLWPSIVLHTALDVHGGAIGYEALLQRARSPSPQVAEARRGTFKASAEPSHAAARPAPMAIYKRTPCEERRSRVGRVSWSWRSRPRSGRSPSGRHSPRNPQASPDRHALQSSYVYVETRREQKLDERGRVLEESVKVFEGYPACRARKADGSGSSPKTDGRGPRRAEKLDRDRDGRQRSSQASHRAAGEGAGAAGARSGGAAARVQAIVDDILIVFDIDMRGVRPSTGTIHRAHAHAASEGDTADARGRQRRSPPPRLDQRVRS